MKLWQVALFVALTCALGLAQAGSATPRQAMQAYLADELSGARLDSERWRRFLADRVMAGEGYDESGWDAVDLVTAAHVGPMTCRDARHCTAEVRFVLAPVQVAAAAPEGGAPNARVGEIREGYVLMRAADGWRVAAWPHADPLPRPRVTPKAWQR
ncbi:hypothetical protein [Inhella crocodyli]|uniref:Nuclear transport factor 2 family protein n=1 Tax=Inhella crocodyli TaxID=2499851 RepID=A0A3S2VFZ1_9BURK|nr:hypothetical protein [Inhella crocodyli]RVT86060.1 hypothetical protein EOD73_08425 [Inhella crocodyli]